MDENQTDMFQENDRVRLKMSSVYRHNPDDRFEIMSFHMDWSFGMDMCRMVKIKNIRTNEWTKTFESQLELDMDYYRKLKLEKLYSKLIGN